MTARLACLFPIWLLATATLVFAQAPQTPGRTGRFGRAAAAPARGLQAQPVPQVRSCDEARAASGADGVSLTPLTRIDFEQFETRGRGEGGQVVLTTQYADRGVTFNSPVVLDYTKAIAIPDFAHSPTRAIQQCYAAEFCSAPIEMRFSEPQARIQTWVGYAGMVPMARPVWLEALDASGTLIDRCAVILPPSRAAQPISLRLEIITPTDRIAVARVVAPELGIADVAVDDIEFQRVAPPPPPSESAAQTPTPPGRPPDRDTDRGSQRVEPEPPEPPRSDDYTIIFVVIGIVAGAIVLFVVARAVTKSQPADPPHHAHPSHITVHPRPDAGRQTLRVPDRRKALEFHIRPVHDTPSIRVHVAPRAN